MKNITENKAGETAFYPKIEREFVHPVLGLAGETGELLNKIKKIFRDEGGTVTEKKKENIAHELGDILWCVSQVATEFDLSLTDIAEQNIAKLQSRKRRGVVKGAGDTR